MKQNKYLYEGLTYKIIGILMKVHTKLGCGFPEKIYQKAVISELEEEKIQFEEEKKIEVIYNGKRIGNFVLDLVIEEKVVLELKATSENIGLFKAQLISYLKASPYAIGILANFGTPKLEYVRLYRRK